MWTGCSQKHGVLLELRSGVCCVELKVISSGGCELMMLHGEKKMVQTREC